MTRALLALRAAIVKAALLWTAGLETAGLLTPWFKSAGILRALLAALRRGVLGRRKVAASRGALRASAAISSTAPAPAATTATVSTTVSAAPSALWAAVVAFAAAIGTSIGTGRIFLRGIVLVREILRGRGVRLRLALFGSFRVCFVMLVWFGFSRMFFAGRSVIFVRRLAGMRFFVMSLVTSFVMNFVVLVLFVLDVKMSMFITSVVSHFVRGVSVPQCFSGQHVDDRGGRRRGHLSVRLRVAVPVIVVFQVFEYVADVEKSVAIEPDVDESRLHAGKYAGNAAFIDTADERELFFAFDVNFD
jgi:hypothetical protein